MTDSSETQLRFQPMLIREVAKIAGEPRETVRTRLKQGIFGFEQAKGWKRFTDFETIIVSVHARLKRSTHNDDLAQVGSLLAAKAIMDEWHEDEKGIPYFDQETFTKPRYLIFWIGSDEKWHAELVQTSEELQAVTSQRFDESQDDVPAFTTVNLKTILSRTLAAMLDVQIEMAKKTEGKK